MGNSATPPRRLSRDLCAPAWARLTLIESGPNPPCETPGWPGPQKVVIDSPSQAPRGGTAQSRQGMGKKKKDKKSASAAAKAPAPEPANASAPAPAPAPEADLTQTLHPPSATTPKEPSAVPATAGEVRQLVEAAATEMLELEPGESAPSSSDQLSEWGLGSVHALELRHLLESTFGIHIDPGTMMQNFSVDGLAEYTVAQLSQPRGPAPAQQPLREVPHDAPDLEPRPADGKSPRGRRLEAWRGSKASRTQLSATAWTRTSSRMRLGPAHTPPIPPVPPPPMHLRDIEMACPSHLRQNPHFSMAEQPSSPSKYYQLHQVPGRDKTNFHDTVKTDGQARLALWRLESSKSCKSPPPLPDRPEYTPSSPCDRGVPLGCAWTELPSVSEWVLKPRDSKSGKPGSQFVDGRGYKIRAGCVPYRMSEQGDLELLLVSSANHQDKWVLPAGTVEQGQERDLPGVASRESSEEAGVQGQIELPGLVVLRDEDKKSLTQWFGLRVTAELSEQQGWEEGGSRLRRWCSVAEARDALEWKGLAQLPAMIGPHKRPLYSEVSAEGLSGKGPGLNSLYLAQASIERPSPSPPSSPAVELVHLGELLQETTNAATRIQAAFRGNKERAPTTEEAAELVHLGELLQETTNAATRIQAAFRGNKERAPTTEEAVELVHLGELLQQTTNAATRIQAAFRGNKERAPTTEEAAERVEPCAEESGASLDEQNEEACEAAAEAIAAAIDNAINEDLTADDELNPPAATELPASDALGQPSGDDRLAALEAKVAELQGQLEQCLHTMSQKDQRICELEAAQAHPLS